MAIIFRPTTSFLHAAIEGDTESRPAYLICGQHAAGYCLGEYSISVNAIARSVSVAPPFEPLMFTALYAFEGMSFYCRRDPWIQLATASHRPVAKGETLQLDLFSGFINTPFPYEKDLNRVLSV